MIFCIFGNNQIHFFVQEILSDSLEYVTECVDERDKLEEFSYVKEING